MLFPQKLVLVNKPNHTYSADSLIMRHNHISAEAFHYSIPFYLIHVVTKVYVKSFQMPNAYITLGIWVNIPVTYGGSLSFPVTLPLNPLYI